MSLSRFAFLLLSATRSSINAQVEGVVFNLHRSILSAASPAFADMFRLGTAAATDSAEGTLVNPIVLDTVCTLNEMNLLARALYGGYVTTKITLQSLDRT